MEAGPGGGGDPERHAVRTAAASRAVQEPSYVPLGDPHLDAKLFPHLHPYGSGSLRAEEGAGGIQRQARSRLTAVDPGFRHCPVWQFFNLDRLIKNNLYFKERKRLERAAAERPRTEPGREDDRGGGGGRKRPREDEDRDAGAAGGGGGGPGDPERIAPYLFGHVEPSHIPESRGWWDTVRRDLYAITEDHEKGMMAGMVTLPQNDRAPELLSHCRRGPCARPTEREKFEYLLARKERGAGTGAVQQDPAAGVLSFQRRNADMKANFLRAYRVTPLGVAEDTFDRTEAQKRWALHGHLHRREKPPKAPRETHEL